ncbi:hypothetical protein Tco_0669649 [Tanacetum coccineum]
MVTLKFASSHNMVAFLDKPIESDGFEKIVDFFNAHLVKYALTVNPTINTLCIEQFWATIKVKTVNREVQIQALVDKKKVIINETSVRSDLQLEDAEGTECLPNTIIFEQLTLMGAKTTAWNEFSSTMASTIICLATNQKFNFSMYIFDNMVKNLEGGVKFLMYLRFVQVFLDNQVEGMSKHKEIYVTPSHTKKVFANMKRQGKDFSGRVTPLFPTMMIQAQEEVEPIPFEAANDENVPTHSNDPLLSEITELKERVKKLEKKEKSRTHVLKRLRKVGRTARVVSSEDEGLGDQEDASKQGRKINEIDQDTEVTLVDEAQGRYGDNLMFDTGVLDNEEMFVEHDMAEKEVDMTEKDVSTADPVTTAGEVVTTANVEVSTARPAEATITDKLTLAQTLTEIKSAMPKAKGITFKEPTKAKQKMIEPEKHLKKKYQIMFDKEVAQKLQAQLEAELEEEEKLARQREEDASIAEWDDVQAMMDADYEVAARLQAKEQGELTIEEMSRLFVEFMDKRKKHFAKHRA